MTTNARIILEVFGTPNASGSNSTAIDFNGTTQASVNLATLNTDISGIGQGITFTCNSTPINFSYDATKFDAILNQSCANPNMSFVVFTPKSGATGNATFGDTGTNESFTIGSIQNQHGDFYLQTSCGTDSSSNPIIIVASDNTIIH